MANKNTSSSAKPRRPVVPAAAPPAAPATPAATPATAPPAVEASAPAATPAAVPPVAAAPTLAEVTRREQSAELRAAPAAVPDLAKAVELTAAEAAAAVKRLVPVLDAAGKPTGETEPVALQESEVQAWAVRGQRVIVVTIDGQKLEGKL